MVEVRPVLLDQATDVSLVQDHEGIETFPSDKAQAPILGERRQSQRETEHKPARRTGHLHGEGAGVAASSVAGATTNLLA